MYTYMQDMCMSVDTVSMMFIVRNQGGCNFIQWHELQVGC